MDPLNIIQISYDNEHERLVAKAFELARALESAAKMIHKAAETRDLGRIAWLTREHDATLAVRADMLCENLALIESFEGKDKP
jgi:hypothetical protein